MGTKKEDPTPVVEKQVTVKEETKVKTVEEKAPNAIERLIYIGPNISKIGLQKYSVFKVNVPQNVEEITKVVPAIKRLIVNVNKLSLAEAAVITMGTAENQALQLVQDYLKGSDK